MALLITQANNPTGCNHYTVTCRDGAEPFTVAFDDTNPEPLSVAEREQLIHLLLRYKRTAGGSALTLITGIAL